MKYRDLFDTGQARATDITLIAFSKSDYGAGAGDSVTSSAV